MPKFFVVSDVHSFFDEMKKALDDAGFDPNNENHWLISCGDEWDRGTKPVEVMQYLYNLPRRILLRGNHTDLFIDCCEHGYPEHHDYSNGTADTISRISMVSEYSRFDEACVKALARAHFFIDEMADYFETQNYIFVHGWIPVICKDNLPSYYTRNRKFEFNPDWRNAHSSEWEHARWLNGMDMARKGFVEPGKTIVCGHWHCSYGHMMDDMAKNELFNCIDEFGKTAIWEPYYGNGIIAIDRCTAHTGEVNVLVLEDEFLEES